MGEALFVGLAVAVASVLLTTLFHVWVHEYSDRVRSIDEQIGHLHRVSSLAVQYWQLDVKVNHTEAEALFHELDGAVALSAIFLDDARNILGFRYNDYINLDDKIFEAATGGDYGSELRDPDFDRLKKTMELVAQQCALLRKARRTIYLFQ